MKTIFITSFHAHISRNILATDFLKNLKARADLKIIILVSHYKTDYFQENFGGPNVTVEGVQLYQGSKNWKRGLFFKRLGIFLFNSDTRRLKKQYKFYRDKKLIYYWGSMTLGLLSRSLLIRKLVRYLDLKFSPKEFFNDLINKYKPTVIFATDVLDENDVSLMQAARLQEIPIFGMFRSWDNPTQSMMRIIPDRLAVGSEEVRKETLELHDVPPRNILIVGQPHYDRYLHGPTKSRKEFFKEMGLDPAQKMIFFTPLGDKFVENNDIDQYVMSILAGIKAQILVRFPPDEQLTLKNFSKPANMVFDKPGVVFKAAEFNDREIGKADDERLVNSIYYSDLVISGPTSINLDAIFFNKPVIAVHLVPTPRHFFDAVYCYWFSHIAKLLKTGGVRYIDKKDEFFRAIDEYLRNPSLDNEQRAQVRSMWFSHADGHSVERLGKDFLDFINEASQP